MATDIGTLAARVTADTSGFTKSMNDVRKSAESTAGLVKGAMSAIPLAVGALAGAGVVGGGIEFFNYLRSGIDEVKDAAKESAKLGMSIEEMAGISRAAGAPAEDFVKAISSMRKELGSIVGPAEDAKSAFHGIGLSGLELKNLSTVDAFGKIADQLNQFTNENEKAYAARLSASKEYLFPSASIFN